MDSLSPSEKSIWDKIPKELVADLSDDEINKKYNSREWRIVTETNRELLPNFVEALNRKDWMVLRPFYQRRHRWDNIRKSKLIESFIMNIPVPPMFVFESDLAKYEVMDGQQRITAIKEFFSNNLVLEGLEQWPELNGKVYNKLPSLVKKGIDRRSVSYTVLLKESAENTEEQDMLRQMVFERLNTGGITLSKQEVRNCLDHGIFNEMLWRLSKNEYFRVAWKLPKYDISEESNPAEKLLENVFYSKMTDIETIARFYALRHIENYKRGMQGFIDLYMLRARKFKEEDITILEPIFTKVVDLAHAVYGDKMFCPWDKNKKVWGDNPSRAYADAVMVGLYRCLDLEGKILEQKDNIVSKTIQMFEESGEKTFTGTGNSKEDIKNRIETFEKMLRTVGA